MTQVKSSSNRAVGLLLLHNDLRIHDNATLLKASLACDSLLIVYCKSPLFKPTLNRGQPYNLDEIGEAKQQFLEETLTDLDQRLQKLGNVLLCLDTPSKATKARLRHQKNHSSIFNQLKQLILACQVQHIFVSETCDYNQAQGYRLLADHVPQAQWHYSITATLFDSLPVERLPKTFTKFRQQVEKDHHLLSTTSDFLLSPSPTKLPPPPLLPTKVLEDLKFKRDDRFTPVSASQTSQSTQLSAFTGGETAALTHLKHYFSSDHPQTYKQTRNALGVLGAWDDTTRFSPWLANGALSVRTLLNRLRQYEKNVVANESTYWIWFELLWREFFYWYADTHGKKLFYFTGITGHKSRNSFYGERFERWKHGSTPYPIVNACMNQLRATGYMSNRGRQLVASCFIHELGMDWRYGASYFESQLIDYDVASNWGNWQYLAGVGADPRGSRKFNLAKQTAQYDPTGEFIKKWNGDAGETQIDSVDMADWYI